MRGRYWVTVSGSYGPDMELVSTHRSLRAAVAAAKRQMADAIEVLDTADGDAVVWGSRR